MTLRASSFVFAALLLSGMLLAQAPPGAVHETAEAVLVEVPVRVVDREGKPIRNLEKPDFELFDDGKRQEILGFDAIDLAQKGTESEDSPVNPAARRHFLILFDLSFAQPKAVLAARRAAKEFVLSGMQDRDFAAVATLSAEKGLRLLVTFSQDRVQLARAIDTLGIVEPSNLASDPLQFIYDAMAAEFGGTSLGGGTLREAQASGLLETMQTLASLERARLDNLARARVIRMTQQLDALARTLDAVQGRKDVILLSEGFESRLLVGTKDTDQENDWIVFGEQWKVDAEKRFGSTHLQSELGSMAQLFRRTDCVIHAVDISGLQTSSDSGSLSPVRGENALFEIANGTGGEVLRNDNDFRAQFSRLMARTSLVYVLAYRPTRSGHADRFHELKVKVRAPGARVSARAGYYERRAFRVQTPLERALSAADALANEIPMHDIPASVLAAAVPGTGSLASVPVLVEASGEGLLASQEGTRTVVEIYAYAYDPDNRVRDFFAQTVTIDLAANRSRLEKSSLKYCGELSLPPGSYRLRVLLRNGETGRTGLAARSLVVPDFSERKPYLAPPVFLESSAGGIVVRGHVSPRSGRAVSAIDLFVPTPGEDLVPAPLPQMQAGRPTRLSLLAYNFVDSPSDALRIGAQVLSPEGRPVKEGSIAVLGKSPAGENGRQMLLVAFTPEGLSPGRYELRVILQDASTGQGRHAASPFVVR